MRQQNIFSEVDRIYHRELIWRKSLELFNKRLVLKPDVILNMQRKYINSFNFNGKNKYKSVDCLYQALYTKDNCLALAHDIFLNTVNRKIMNSV